MRCSLFVCTPSFSIQDRAGLLILCGCKRGGRLTSNEMKTVNRVTLDMANVYDRLEALFHILIPRTTRVRTKDENAVLLLALPRKTLDLYLPITYLMNYFRVTNVTKVLVYS